MVRLESRYGTHAALRVASSARVAPVLLSRTRDEEVASARPRQEPHAQAVSIKTNAAGHAVLDFGKHQFGWLEVDVKKPGPYKIVWGELLDEKGSVQTGRRYTRSEGRIRCATTEGVFDGVGTQRIPYKTGPGNAFFTGNRVVKRDLPKFGMVMPFRWA